MSRPPIPPLGPNPLLGRQIRPLREATEQISELAAISGLGGLQLTRLPTGAILEDLTQPVVPLTFHAIVVSTGPNGDADTFTDSRYFFQSVSPGQVAFATETDAAYMYVDGLYWAVATNLPETPGGTHNLTAVAALATGATIPAGAILVKVTLQASSKATNAASDNANYIYTMEPVVAGSPTMAVYGKITASSAVSSVEWNYTAQNYTGTVTYARVRNGMEPVNGSPGKLGVTVATSGTTNGGCTVKAIGTNAEVLLFPDPSVSGGWMFSMANSAE